ncbi:MAG: hypothetical protein R3C20_02235 [Planctomycetaceae bacterium]
MNSLLSSRFHASLRSRINPQSALLAACILFTIGFACFTSATIRGGESSDVPATEKLEQPDAGGIASRINERISSGQLPREWSRTEAHSADFCGPRHHVDRTVARPTHRWGYGPHGAPVSAAPTLFMLGVLLRP